MAKHQGQRDILNNLEERDKIYEKKLGRTKKGTNRQEL
jgi:hypothetical protein